MTRRLSDYIESPLDDASLERVWARVAQNRRQAAHWRGRRRVIGAGSLLLLAGVLLGWALRSPLSSEQPQKN